MKQTAELLTEKDKFSPEGYWKLKKSVTRKPTSTITSILRSDKLEVQGEKLIKDEFKKEFEHRLRNRSPHAEWEEYTRNINETLEIIMELVQGLGGHPGLLDARFESSSAKTERREITWA